MYLRSEEEQLTVAQLLDDARRLHEIKMLFVIRTSKRIARSWAAEREMGQDLRDWRSSGQRYLLL